MMNEFVFQSATELTRAIQDRRISSVELLELYIQRFQRLNPVINAIVATDFENARGRARMADEALAKGENWGPLHGLPMTIKDSFEVIGMPCTSGAPEFKNNMPGRNAHVVQNLLDAGAVVFGKTNLPVYAMDFQSYNDVYGQTNNPWDVSKIPGGSSGGAAAALAAGLTGLEIGSDIGGSIRNPAHFCGVYGLKPSFDIIPMRGHIPPPPGIFKGDYSLTADIAVAGPLARSTNDLDLVLDLIVAPPKHMKRAWNIKLPQARKRDLKDYKIGLCLNDPVFPVDTQVADVIQNVIDTLAKMGVKIEEKKPDIDFARSHEIYTQLLSGVSGAGLPQEIFDQALDEASNLLESDKGYRAQWLRGVTLSQRNWSKLNYQRMKLRQKWANFFREFDIFLCPVAPVTAFPHDHSPFFDRKLTLNDESRAYADTLLAWAGLTCVAYLPATSAPIGLAKNGLPVGVQIVSAYLEDRTSIHFARLLEESIGGFVAPPGYE
jgi:amidase